LREGRLAKVGLARLGRRLCLGRILKKARQPSAVLVKSWRQQKLQETKRDLIHHEKETRFKIWLL
jgi:hypothetical protein